MLEDIFLRQSGIWITDSVKVSSGFERWKVACSLLRGSKSPLPFAPLFKSFPGSGKENAKLYKFLVLMDGMGIGGACELLIAEVFFVNYVLV